MSSPESARATAETFYPPPKAAPFAGLAVLPHEWTFGAFLAVAATCLTLAQSAASPQALVLLTCLAGAIAVTFWTQRRPTDRRWRVRLLAYPAMMGLAFFTLDSAVPLIGGPPADAPLARWDEALLGAPVAQWFERSINPWLTDLMALAYAFFFYYLIAGPAHYCVRDVDRFRRCFVGLFTIYGAGFLGYVAVPAGGPHRFLEFDQPLMGRVIAPWLLPLLDRASNGVDAFPSIHVAASFFLLLFDARHRPERCRAFAVPCVVMWLSTLYLRYHYLADALAGFALGAAGAAVTWAYERSALARRVEAETRRANVGGSWRAERDSNLQTFDPKSNALSN